VNADPHMWKTPQSPRGMPPSAWPAKRRRLYVEALEVGDPTAPKPVHAPGECQECDLMRELTSLADDRKAVGEPAAAADAQLQPDGYTIPALGKPWVAGPTLFDRIGDVKAYPGTVALLLGMMAGIGLCSIFGPGWAVAVALVLGVLLVIGAS
jgi:hypothetical protein